MKLVLVNPPSFSKPKVKFVADLDTLMISGKYEYMILLWRKVSTFTSEVEAKLVKSTLVATERALPGLR